MKKAFTLIEVLLVVAIIAILAGIVILAINPTKQLDDANEAQAAADVNTIINGVYQYAIDNAGTLPASITTTATEICETGGTCTGLVDLSILTVDDGTSPNYLVAIPNEPGDADANGVGYTILRDGTTNRVTVASDRYSNITVTR